MLLASSARLVRGIPTEEQVRHPKKESCPFLSLTPDSYQIAAAAAISSNLLTDAFARASVGGRQLALD
jgi:hypothetical protein